jgi:hypothetical protein
VLLQLGPVGKRSSQYGQVDGWGGIRALLDQLLALFVPAPQVLTLPEKGELGGRAAPCRSPTVERKVWLLVEWLRDAPFRHDVVQLGSVRAPRAACEQPARDAA